MKKVTPAEREPMKNAVRAEITWLRPNQGGRKRLPSLSEYRSVSRFLEDPDSSRFGTWDVIVRFAEPPNEHSYRSLAWIAFRSKDAPRGLLSSGRLFDLTEGKKIVARGVVL